MRTNLAAAAVLAAGTLLGALTARAADDKASAQLTEDEAAKVAEDAYVFGYPLVLMDVTEGRLDGGPQAARDQGADQPVRQRAGVSRRHVHRRGQPQRRHPLLPRLARPGQGADGLERPGHGEALLPDADDGRLDERLRRPGTRTTGNGKGDLRHRRAGLDGRSCPRVSRNSSPRRTWSGSSAARRPTARTITRRSTPSRTSTS